MKRVNHEIHKNTKGNLMNIIYKLESYEIMGACFVEHERIAL